MLGDEGSRVLIVDDEREITEILSDLFSDRHKCTKAGSAEEALERLRESEFELVISDITMPGMSGLEMLPQVKSLSPYTVAGVPGGVRMGKGAIEPLGLAPSTIWMSP